MLVHYVRSNGAGYMFPASLWLGIVEEGGSSQPPCPYIRIVEPALRINMQQHPSTRGLGTTYCRSNGSIVDWFNIALLRGLPTADLDSRHYHLCASTYVLCRWHVRLGQEGSVHETSQTVTSGMRPGQPVVFPWKTTSVVRTLEQQPSAVDFTHLLEPNQRG